MFPAFLLSLLLLHACDNTPAVEKPHREEHQAKTLKKKKEKVITGKVVGISDGDTFKLLVEGNENIRVRLHGVDAPEKAQDYSTQAREKLSSLIFSKSVEVEERDIDRYGRMVGVVYVGDTNVNEELLRSGYVWHYAQYDKNEVWARLMQEAREAKRGLWNKANPTPPWQFRKEKREKAAIEE